MLGTSSDVVMKLMNVRFCTFQKYQKIFPNTPGRLKFANKFRNLFLGRLLKKFNRKIVHDFVKKGAITFNTAKLMLPVIVFSVTTGNCTKKWDI